MDIILALSAGTRGAVARSTDVAHYIAAHPKEIHTLISAMGLDDTVTVSHAAHALHSVFRMSPSVLQQVKAELLDVLLQAEQWELLEQLGKVLPHLGYSHEDHFKLASKFKSVLEKSTSSIARTYALEALWQLAQQHAEFEADMKEAMVYSFEKGTKAMQARARKLLAQ